MNTVHLPSGSAIWHVDWSIHQDKRWMTQLTVQATGGWVLDAARPFSDVHDRVLGITNELPPVLVIGLDMPIGLPMGYAKAVGITDFCQFLTSHHGPDWAWFSQVSRSLDTVSLHRPFFPYHVISERDQAGGKPQTKWLEKLGLTREDTYRQCDLATTQRNAAASLFWTKGANQVGKAALSGWAELVAPLLRDPEASVGIWPFHGDLADLVSDRRIVLVETYPGEIYSWFGCAPKSKRKQQARQSVTSKLAAAAADLALDVTPAARKMLADGFGNDERGEDRFDSFVGALGLAAVLKGKRPAPVPTNPIFRSVEGWILGQELPEQLM